MAKKSNRLSIVDSRVEVSGHPRSELRRHTSRELDEAHGIETSLAELAARFINLPTDQLDDAIEEAQRLVCESLGLDRSALFQRSDQEPERLSLTHWYLRAGAKVPSANGPLKLVIHVLDGPNLRQSSVPVEVTSSFPWIHQQLRTRQTVVIPNVEAMPMEATLDREWLQAYGTKSTIILPLFTGGRWLGCVTFAAMQERRDWSEATVRSFEFVANIFTNALVRKQADLDLRESEARLALATEAAEAGLWTVEGGTWDIWATPRFRELFQFAPQEKLDYQALLARIHPEEAGGVRHAIERALATGDELRLDYRIVLPGGSIRWISARGRRQKGSGATPVRLMGAAIDVTERRHAQEALTSSYAEIKQLKDRLQAERDYLKSEFKVSQGHGHIIGRSKGIKQVLHLVEQVAPADCAVLVSGETGTGKELIAQEIHRLSARKEHVMVLVNCAALPSALVESELFGRERGAYTGALTTQVGRFEVANNSSVFLDEVGELSMEVQAKLLRVLQQGEFQRLGSPKTYKVDVRVIAATNRDLAEDVRKGRFREDLYYRLKVFPIQIPPLRERVEDIPLMAFAFMEEFSTRMGKRVTKIPRKAMEALQTHTWQGNIREFRNVIEHSVIVTSGDTLKLSLLGESPTRAAQPVTLAEAEREHILKTLQNTAWRIKGPHGAAARLGLQPSTLYSRMQKLGIPHRRQKDEMATQG
jgi:formate hydrogenlyase transcriptional activator